MEVIQINEEVMLELSSENRHAFSTMEYNNYSGIVTCAIVRLLFIGI